MLGSVSPSFPDSRASGKSKKAKGLKAIYSSTTPGLLAILSNAPATSFLFIMGCYNQRTAGWKQRKGHLITFQTIAATKLAWAYFELLGMDRWLVRFHCFCWWSTETCSVAAGTFSEYLTKDLGTLSRSVTVIFWTKTESMAANQQAPLEATSTFP